MAYRLMFDCEQLQTPLLDAQMALSKLRLCDLFWAAWTEFGGVGEGRRAVLGKSDKSSQGSGHPGLDPTVEYIHKDLFFYHHFIRYSF